MDIEKVIVENGINTCYIDTLLMVLFFRPSITEKILSKDVDDTNKIILQGSLMEQFISKVRNGGKVDADTMMFIRETLHQLGWRSDEDIYEQQDVSELYSFLLELFDGETIKTKRTTYSEAVDEDNKSSSDEESVPYISLNISENKLNKTTVRNLFNEWLYHNSCEIKRKTIVDGKEVIIDVPALNQYSIVNTPSYLGLSINRFVKEKKIKTLLNISTYLRINEDETFYSIQGAICHRGETKKMGHYYALICDIDHKIFYVFDDLKSPSLEIISMDEIERTKKIASEIVFMVYSKMPK